MKATPRGRPRRARRTPVEPHQIVALAAEVADGEQPQTDTGRYRAAQETEVVGHERTGYIGDHRTARAIEAPR
jgi:hypothetical protein